MNFETLLPLLRCPRTDGPLAIRGDTLVSASGEVYPIVSGKPILVRTIREWHLNPPAADKVSRNIASFQPISPAIRPGSAIVHLGSGNVPADDPRVISCDVLPCEHVDLVCEAEALPFRDRCIDYIESGAVFEHVHDPWRAIAEVKRVLAPGGEFRIDTAFMQGYHGFPSHYYNMTPQAVETALVGACELRQGCVPASATPLMTVVMAVERYLGFLSADLRRRLLDARLGDVLDEMREDLSFGSPLLADFDDYAQRCLAASYVVVGRKPPSTTPRSPPSRRAGTATPKRGGRSFANTTRCAWSSCSVITRSATTGARLASGPPRSPTSRRHGRWPQPWRPWCRRRCSARMPSRTPSRSVAGGRGTIGGFVTPGSPVT